MPIIHQQVPATVRATQVLGVIFTAFIAGQTASTTLLFTSIMLQAPAPLLARQWKTLWFKANGLVPAVSVGMSVLFAWLAWRGMFVSSSFSRQEYFFAYGFCG